MVGGAGQVASRPQRAAALFPFELGPPNEHFRWPAACATLGRAPLPVAARARRRLVRVSAETSCAICAPPGGRSVSSCATGREKSFEWASRMMDDEGISPRRCPSEFSVRPRTRLGSTRTRLGSARSARSARLGLGLGSEGPAWGEIFAGRCRGRRCCCWRRRRRCCCGSRVDLEPAPNIEWRRWR